MKQDYRCPECRQRISHPEPFRKRFACPHCEAVVVLARESDAAFPSRIRERRGKEQRPGRTIAVAGAIAAALAIVVGLAIMLAHRGGGEKAAVAAKVEPTPTPEFKPPPGAFEELPSPKVAESAPKVEPPADIKPRPKEEAPEPKVKVPAFVVAPPTPKIPGVSRERIALAIEKGLAYLKARQLGGGTWPCKDHEVGYAALCGLALVECGMPVSDPNVAKAAAFVRANLPGVDHTYDLSLAVLFLDRLEQPADRVIIQGLALRLAAGQNAQGGWDYKCPKLSAPEMHALLTFMRSYRPKTAFEVAVRDDFLTYVGQAKETEQSSERPERQSGPHQPAWAKDACSTVEAEVQEKPSGAEQSDQPPGQPPFQPPPRASHKAPEKVVPKPPPGDVAVGRWAEADLSMLSVSKREAWLRERGAARGTLAPPKPPAVRAKPRSDASAREVKKSVAAPRPRLDLLPPKLRELPAVGGLAKAPRKTRDDNSNSQFALLALWASRRHDVGAERALQYAGWRYRVTQNADAGWGYQIAKGSTPPMTCVGLLGLAMSIATAPDLPMAREKTPDGRIILDDPQVLRALKKAAESIGHPALSLEDVRMKSAYLLWSVERMAMLYGLPTIGGKDWYGWGAQILIKHQQDDGGWNGGGYHGSNEIVDTAFALLFLRRSNLAHEFTDSLHQRLAIVEMP